MNKEIADRWIKALRSGKYPQIQGKLRKEEGFCCLGVLCDIHDNKQWGDDLGGFSYLSNSGVIPEKVRKWAGMKSRDGSHLPRMGYPERRNRNLSGLNDNGRTFEQIADVIEEHWEEL